MRQRRLMNQINVVPYIDVMLVLLVIFMVTAPMIQTGSVELPRVGDVPQPPSDAITVFVRTDEFDSTKVAFALQVGPGTAPVPMSSSDLQRALQQARERDPAQSVVVAADRQVRYENVMDMLNALRTEGFQKVGLLTDASAGAK
ncbi:MAG TPA: ExbD/TolR family protein [Rhodocyclaceae bacterium]|nr:ExbD/TolR family protein [Rhodocyclaceae bacterium]HRQ46810.1 ExbD/TolR family protein [Rhodocyclaceae bacterium]